MKYKYEIGQKVECNGNKEAVIDSYYSCRMYNVKLFSGSRFVGMVCVDESDIKPL